MVGENCFHCLQDQFLIFRQTHDLENINGKGWVSVQLSRKITKNKKYHIVTNPGQAGIYNLGKLCDSCLKPPKKIKPDHKHEKPTISPIQLKKKVLS